MFHLPLYWINIHNLEGPHENNIDSVLQIFGKLKNCLSKNLFYLKKKNFVKIISNRLINLMMKIDIQLDCQYKKMLTSQEIPSIWQSRDYWPWKLSLNLTLNMKKTNAFMLEYEELKHISIVKNRNSSKFEYTPPRLSERVTALLPNFASSLMDDASLLILIH